MKNKKRCYLRCKKHCYLESKNLVAWKARNFYLAILIVLCCSRHLNFWPIWKPIQGGHHVYCVPKSLKLEIDKSEGYLISKKQIGLSNKLGYNFVHGYLIKVLHVFGRWCLIGWRLWQVFQVKERENSSLESQGISLVCVHTNLPFYIAFFPFTLKFSFLT